MKKVMKFFDTTIANLVANLPLPRLLLIVGLFVCLLFIGGYLYESYTATLGLTREDKSIQLIKDLLELEKNEVLNSEYLMKIYSKAVERTEDLLLIKSKTISWWKKGIASSWLWLGIVCCSLCLRTKGWLTVFMVSLVLAVITFWFGTEISSLWWPWFHAVVFVMIPGILAFIGFRFSVKKSGGR